MIPQHSDQIVWYQYICIHNQTSCRWIHAKCLVMHELSHVSPLFYILHMPWYFHTNEFRGSRWNLPNVHRLSRLVHLLTIHLISNSRWWNVNNANLILVLVGKLRDVHLKVWHRCDIMRQWNVDVCITVIIDEMVSFIAIHTWNYS